MAEKLLAATISQFNGLRTDTPATKCPSSYSPDCSDLVFTASGVATRNPLRVSLSMPAEIIFDETFMGRDGTTYRAVVDVNGAIWSVNSDKTYVQIDSVLPGSQVSHVIAYGRIYMAFFNAQGGCDATRQWDGKNVYRVAHGAPGAPPSVSNLSLALSNVSSGSRIKNLVTLVTSVSHNLQKGYLANIANVAAFIQNITSIVINNETLPGIGVVTVPMAHGLVPGNAVAIDNVEPTVIGGHLVSWNRVSKIVTLVTATAHGLQVGSTPLVELQTDGFGAVIVLSVPSLTSFTFSNNGGDGSGTAGGVMLPWPFDSGTLFTIVQVPTPTTFRFSIAFTDGTFTTGNIAFDWDGSFYVETVISPTSFTYRQIGPDADISGSTGLVTPTGQLAAGDHLVCQHFITKNDFITGPSPSVRFTASGGQYIQIDDLAIGPADVKGRILSFTGTNGSRFFMILTPATPNGQQVSTSTRIDDNTTTSIVMDFGDTTLLDATGIDIPGNNLFQYVTLDTPSGVEWFGDRLFWWGGRNKVTGLINPGMDGGTAAGSTHPLGWTATAGTVVQVGTAAAYVGPGTLTQGVANTANGVPILQPLQPYLLRAWGTAGGSIAATVSSAITGFSSTCVVNFAGTGYVSAPFSLAMPSAIPQDLILTLNVTGTFRDLHLIYASNPNRNPKARGSYVQVPEGYDNLTGNVGPNDDSTELRASFVLQESLYFITAKRLYYVSSIGNQEPSAWDPQMVSDKCGTFHANCVVTGKGWSMWGGDMGVFWYSGGIPRKISNYIKPTWKAVAGMTNARDDEDAQRVYFGIIDATGQKSVLTYDYHEVEQGGEPKWCPWNRAVSWISQANEFAVGNKVYTLAIAAGIEDDNLGLIGGYYTFSPFAPSAYRKDFNYLGLRMSGLGVMTPFLYGMRLTTLTQALNGQNMAALLDIVAEWPVQLTARLLFLKLGQPGLSFALEEVTASYILDANAPISGVR
jgi:hypothetical protein